MSKLHIQRFKIMHSIKHNFNAWQRNSEVIFKAAGDASRMVSLTFKENDEPSFSKLEFLLQCLT